MRRLEQLKERMRGNPVLFWAAKAVYSPVTAVKKLGELPVRRQVTQQALAKIHRAAKEGAERRAFLCGAPIHRNLGDQAQRFCISRWIRENYPGHSLVELPTWPFYDGGFRRRFEDLVRPGDLLVVQSGYCTTSRHMDHKMHRYLAERFPENPLLIMPQTVNFDRPGDAAKTAALYNAHRGLLFLARDEVSYQAAKKYFSRAAVRKYPDIVTGMIGTRPGGGRRNGVLLCFRDDTEKLYSDEAVAKLEGHFAAQGQRVSRTDTNYGPGESPRTALEGKLAQFAAHRVVITDRYHGTIFALIADTPVVVVATTDHKVTTGLAWFQGVYDGSVFGADSLEEARAIAEDLLRDPREIHNAAYFQEAYYSRLRQEFEAATQQFQGDTTCATN